MIADGDGGYPEIFVPHVASEPSSHAATVARSRMPPPGGAGQQSSGGTFGDLLDSAATPAPDQAMPATEQAPQRDDKPPAPPPAKEGQTGAASGKQAGNASPGRGAPDPGKVADDEPAESTGIKSGETGKTKKSGSSDQDKKGDEADNGKTGVKAAGGSPAAAAVAVATTTPAQAGTPHPPSAESNDVPAGDAVKSALTPPSVLQVTHGSAAESQTPNGKHQTPSDGITTSGLDAMAPAAGIQAAAAKGKAVENQTESQKSTDAGASTPDHVDTRDALHRLMPADAAPDTNKHDSNAAAKTTVQTSTPLPATTPAPQAASSLSSAPVQQAAAPAPPPVPVPLAGVPIAIAGKALAGKNHFEIRLDPPELGRIDVRLDVDKDGRITSHVIADRKDTLNLLQRDASGLQRALQDAGLKTADSGLQFSLRDQWSNGNSGQQSSSGHHRTQIIFPEETAPVSATAPRVYGRFFSRAGGIDIRV